MVTIRMDGRYLLTVEKMIRRSTFEVLTCLESCNYKSRNGCMLWKATNGGYVSQHSFGLLGINTICTGQKTLTIFPLKQMFEFQHRQEWLLSVRMKDAFLCCTDVTILSRTMVSLGAKGGWLALDFLRWSHYTCGHVLFGLHEYLGGLPLGGKG